MTDTIALLRPVLWRFALAMEAQLRANDNKPGWDGDPLESLLQRLREESDELASEIYKRAFGEKHAITKEAADVANFAMMIADNSRDLPRLDDALAAAAEDHDATIRAPLEQIIFALILAYDIDGEALSSAAFLPSFDAYLLVEKARKGKK